MCQYYPECPVGRHRPGTRAVTCLKKGVLRPRQTYPAAPQPLPGVPCSAVASRSAPSFQAGGIVLSTVRMGTAGRVVRSIQPGDEEWGLCPGWPVVRWSTEDSPMICNPSTVISDV